MGLGIGRYLYVKGLESWLRPYTFIYIYSLCPKHHLDDLYELQDIFAIDEIHKKRRICSSENCYIMNHVVYYCLQFQWK